MVKYYCVICEGTNFTDFRGRKLEECTKCRSKARTRASFLAMKITGIFDIRDRRVLHLAPEKGLSAVLARHFGAGYYACDFDPTRYAFDHAPTHKLNLCADEYDIGTFDYILHNHVLEHVPCNPLLVVSKLDKLLNPGGIHIFTVPFSGSITRENLDPGLSTLEREKAFGQADHMRVFGSVDFPHALAELRGVINPKFPMLARFSRADLDRYRIPAEDHSKVTGGTVFFYQSPLQ
ncbi:class I SAM-dependent methyltransferase [Hansschlegelia zhihuaiae]|uniref:Methyltransferase domain-containing protein n=1 Tax=Hansschlegelia zhihuaiae TaxID=405005 RepID=A0A4Q0ML65_9HYPH|nr:methyltransferase domain-containing protein [Hansschlegelia zhihuaiae]RXF74451.1 methyltransferase domain-containing protein [Hansschlegelia zhihuaiae]